ncbi:hypothetical protein AAFF_G00273750 [Aldrovandia affinis]|uniref:Uncharacterized protein n=1 Tax=Aldrovandia affinis TaxID=143900 RepID=A0AAD7WSL8_9TELE|nr:hypothetical protein AAFF_G00273750 [Aldrovandia affinis]
MTGGQSRADLISPLLLIRSDASSEFGARVKSVITGNGFSADTALGDNAAPSPIPPAALCPPRGANERGTRCQAARCQKHPARRGGVTAGVSRRIRLPRSRKGGRRGEGGHAFERNAGTLHAPTLPRRDSQNLNPLSRAGETQASNGDRATLRDLPVSRRQSES